MTNHGEDENRLHHTVLKNLKVQINEDEIESQSKCNMSKIFLWSGMKQHRLTESTESKPWSFLSRRSSSNLQYFGILWASTQAMNKSSEQLGTYRTQIWLNFSHIRSVTSDWLMMNLSMVMISLRCFMPNEKPFRVTALVTWLLVAKQLSRNINCTHGFEEFHCKISFPPLCINPLSDKKASLFEGKSF